MPARVIPRGIERRGRARVGSVDFERRGDEEEEAAAAFDDDDLAAARSEHVETHAPQFGVLLRGDAFVETFAFDRDRDVTGSQRDAAGVRVFARFERIVVRAREQAVPERPAPSASAAGVAREFDRDLGGRQADERTPFGDRPRTRENREPAKPRTAGADRKGAAARVGRRLQCDAVLGLAVERIGQQVAHRWRDRLILTGGEPQMLPLGILDQDAGVDGAVERWAASA